MKKIIISILALVFTTAALAQKKGLQTCSADCTAKNKTGELSCKLTSKELHARKTTIIAGLKKDMLERKELTDGYAFRFKGSDEMIDRVTDFIKTERNCCDFFVFNLSIAGDKNELWLEMKGPEGSKDFVTDELGM